MGANSAYAEHYTYHGNLERIPWECTTDEDKRYLKERIHDIEQCRIYVDYERKTINWKATYAWIEEGMRALPQPSLPHEGYMLDKKTYPHHPRIKKIKDLQSTLRAQQPAASHTTQAKAKSEHVRQGWKHFTFGRSIEDFEKPLKSSIEPL